MKKLNLFLKKKGKFCAPNAKAAILGFDSNAIEIIQN